MRPPVLPSASMTLLFAVAFVAIYWITAAVAELRLQHDYSKFAADARSSDQTRRPAHSAGHATDPVTVSATAAGVAENVTSVVSNDHTPAGLSVVPPVRRMLLASGTFTADDHLLLPPPQGIQMDHAPVGEEPRGMKVFPSQCATAARVAATPINVIGNEHRCKANVATIGTLVRARPLQCVRRDPADASRTRYVTTIHTDSTDTKETK